MGFCLASVYFDDLTVQDLGSMRGSAQQFITSLATEMGSPFQPEKHEAMQSQSDFLGLVSPWSTRPFLASRPFAH